MGRMGKWINNRLRKDVNIVLYILLRGEKRYHYVGKGYTLRVKRLHSINFIFFLLL